MTPLTNQCTYNYGGARVVITTVVHVLLENSNVSFLNVATFQHLKWCHVALFEIMQRYKIPNVWNFRQKCRKDFRKMLRCLSFPNLSGKHSQLTGKTSPLVGNYLKSQVMTSCLCFFSRFAHGSFECLRLIASR